MRVALLFIDGVGVGRRDPSINPLARGPFLLSQFDDGTGEPLPSGTLVQVDTTFSVPGRPQSASNQAALFTGDPAPALIGKHLLGFPNAPLRELLARRSIVKRLAAKGRTTVFTNCYPAGFLDAIGLARRPSRGPDVVLSPAHLRKVRASAIPLAMAAGGLALRTLDDAREGQGLTHDLDGGRARAHGFDVPLRSADEAAEIFWTLAERADFTVFEHYLADEAGHAQDFSLALTALSAFDAFARAVVARLPPDAFLIICSDHGNVEDLSSRRHTENPVPVLLFGSADHGPPPLATLADVGKRVLHLLGVAD